MTHWDQSAMFSWLAQAGSRCLLNYIMSTIRLSSKTVDVLYTMFIQLYALYYKVTIMMAREQHV